MKISTAERKTLETISNPDSTEYVPRTHLEKLSRLDLIEPTEATVILSLKGKKILFGGNN